MAQVLTEILKDALKEKGYDGLCNPGIACGCDLEDFMPCGAADLDACAPGYKRTMQNGHWVIYTGGKKC